jgi:RHS repeat-associated protein
MRYLKQQNIMIAELDESNAIIRSYAFQPNGFEPIATTEGNSTYWYLNDHLMTPQKVVDDTQSVVWAGEYSAFGEVSITVNMVENNLRFPGQYWDVETGLHYNYYRSYEASIGRYLQSDPLITTHIHLLVSFIGIGKYPLRAIAQKILFGMQSGNAFLLNPLDGHLYTYVQNNPVMNMDEFGLHYQPAGPHGGCMPHRDLPSGGAVQDPSCDCFGNCPPPRPQPNPVCTLKCNAFCKTILGPGFKCPPPIYWPFCYYICWVYCTLISS